MAEGMRVVVAGGTGLVGRHLAEALAREGAEVRILSRRPGQPYSWDDLPRALEGAGAVVNLAGEGIADRRWTASRKEAILRSRVEATERLVAAMGALPSPPSVLVNASAVGIYGPMDGRPVDEGREPGKGFLAKVCRQWEAAADGALALGVRVVKLRLGVVLARDGGALPKMAFPVRMFQGAKLGHGQQGLSWIHVDDLSRLVLAALGDPAYAGPVNATAPRPVTNETFTRALARRLHRPLLPVPGFVTRTALGALFGEMGREMLLEGAFVYPRRAQELGFAFRFERVEDALADLLDPA
ncbi:TIGR01777 family oxidoreductase [Mesoterricola silvestris]|uniref:Epimerase family protein YfcH n=1 Tax=Mesoterricola silvestris TaxID=2927979 RepID=A0AA48GWF3_9BACT|nr:TIGR01777 family oxidoreductase [Mesoterricola silvestris]BDU73096.1 epimerase family protein YfcH [Mesoterricola silvestris]